MVKKTDSCEIQIGKKKSDPQNQTLQHKNSHIHKERDQLEMEDGAKQTENYNPEKI